MISILKKIAIACIGLASMSAAANEMPPCGNKAVEVLENFYPSTQDAVQNLRCDRRAGQPYDYVVCNATARGSSLKYTVILTAANCIHSVAYTDAPVK